MMLENVKKRISPKHRKLRKEVVKKFKEHGIDLKGSVLLEYNKEELLEIKKALSELETKHDMLLEDLLFYSLIHGFVPRKTLLRKAINARGSVLRDLLRGRNSEKKSFLKFFNNFIVHTTLKEKNFLKLLNDCIEKYAQHTARDILENISQGELKEIEYKGKKIKLTEEDLARFLKEHGLKHAEKILDKLTYNLIHSLIKELQSETEKYIT